MTNQMLPTQNTGTEITRFNALRHGVLSRYTVLPWEDANEYGALLAALLAEHNPIGPTEEHLVEELAGVLWRKRRLRLAEAAAYQHGLENATEPFRNTVKAALAHLGSENQTDGVIGSIRATPEQTKGEARDLDEDEAMTAKALKILSDGKAQSYKKAVAALRADTREWWDEVLDRDPEEFDEDEAPASRHAGSLRRFIDKELVPWYAERRKELEHRPLIRAQAFGQSLDPNKLEGLARYEVHLDRKLERMLSMLLRLKDLRVKTIEE